MTLKNSRNWRAVVSIPLILALGTSCASSSSAPVSAVSEIPLPNKERQQSLSPEQVVEKLNRGNQRSVLGELRNYNRLSRRQITSVGGQYPVAAVLACIDSRSIPEKVFDLSKGDLFVARVAGTVVNEDVLGSLEYATAVAGAKVILVLGHTSCGAVDAACRPGTKPGHIESLVSKIRPNVISSDSPTKGELLVSVEQNTKAMAEAVLRESTLISELVQDGKLIVRAAVHDISNGKVTYLDLAPLSKG